MFDRTLKLYLVFINIKYLKTFELIFSYLDLQLLFYI